MKTKIWLTLLLFSAAVFVAPQVLAQTANWNLQQDSTQGDDDDQGGGIGASVAGAWLGKGTFSVDLGCDGEFDFFDIPFDDATTFGVGGDRMVTNPANPNTNHGTWKKTGPRQVTGRDVSFGATPAIISIVVNFDHDFQNAISTTFGANIYSATQDPLDPTEIPIHCSVGQHDSYRKVNATE